MGFLGPGPVAAHLDHAAGFLAAIRRAWDEENSGPGGGLADMVGEAADLGSGGGLPGLPLAVAVPTIRMRLVESSVRRAAFLRRAVEILGLTDRVVVEEARAEVVARTAGVRGTLDLVVARGFGPPAVVAECAAPLLRVGGRAVISEPPGGRPDRWPPSGLAMVGMALGPAVSAVGSTYQVLVQRAVCPDRYPRRVGVPAKRPLF